MKTIINETTDTVNVMIEGWLDANESAKFTEDMKPYFTEHKKKMVIDCGKLEYISSSGLRTFLLLRKACGNVVIKNVNDDVKKVFKMTGFYNMFEIQD